MSKLADACKKNFSRLNSGHCTWSFDIVFGVKIGDICYDHDAAYSAGTAKLKMRGDVNLIKALWRRSKQQQGWRNPAIKFTTVVMGSAVCSFGWLFWGYGCLTGENGIHA